MQFLEILLQTFEWIVIIAHCCLLVWLTYVRFLETVNNGFLWYGIPWWYHVFHCLENTNLWKRFVTLHCFDGIWGFVLHPGPLVEEQTLHLEAGKSGWCSWGSWFQGEQGNCQSEGQLFCFELERMSPVFWSTLQIKLLSSNFFLRSVSAGTLLYIFKAPCLFGLANHKHFQLFPSCTSGRHSCQSVNLTLPPEHFSPDRR